MALLTAPAAAAPLASIHSLDGPLLLRILRLLSFRDKCRALAACRLWRTLLAGAVYSADEEAGDSCCNQLALPAAAGTRSRESYIQMLERISLCPLASHLQSLTLCWAQQRATRTLIAAAAPSLRSLQLEGFPEARYAASETPRDCLDLSAHTHLERLLIRETPVALLVRFATLPPSLRRLELCCNDVHKFSEAVACVTASHTALRELRLVTNAVWETVPSLADLSRLTDLTKLVLGCNNDTAFEVRLASLYGCCCWHECRCILRYRRSSSVITVNPNARHAPFNVKKQPSQSSTI